MDEGLQERSGLQSEEDEEDECGDDRKSRVSSRDDAAGLRIISAFCPSEQQKPVQNQVQLMTSEEDLMVNMEMKMETPGSLLSKKLQMFPDR